MTMRLVTGFGQVNFLSVDDLRAAAEHGTTLMKARIVHRSQRADGAPLSPYSTKPIHVPKKGLGTGEPRVKPPGGKRGAKTVYFAGGYLAFRKAAGRSPTKDITLSGNLMRRLRVKMIVRNTVYMGWPPAQEPVAAQLDKQEKELLFSWSDQEVDEVEERIAQLIMENLIGNRT